MGRELMVDRIDFMKDGTVIIRECSDYFVCGRNDFSNAFANLFYNRGVEYLIVDYDRSPVEGKDKIHVLTEGSCWSEKEFDMEFSCIDLDTVNRVCDEYIEKDNIELARENTMLNDAYCARRNTRTVKDFEEFSDLIDDLEKHIDDYCEHAKIYSKYINKLNLCCDERTTEKCYILLTLSE